MRILVTGNCTPFIEGGAQSHLQGLQQALQAAGHEVATLLLPFTFSPESSLTDLMAYTERLDWERPNGQVIDRIISLQFPSYGISHSHHVAWIMHQHRAVYDLYDETSATPALRELKSQIETFDRRALSQTRHVFANSQNVVKRLQQHLQVDATPLYHPPPDAASCYNALAEGYVYFPSRVEHLKRQHLLLEAARLMKSPLKIIFSGSGGQAERLQKAILEAGLEERVRYIGHVSTAEKLAFYAHATAVAYPVRDEDYGYVTLEAMLSSKPVLTCTDSGGPLEWITSGLNGWVCEPEPAALAEQLDWIALHPQQVVVMGQIARESYDAVAPTWQGVVESLLSV
jgi:glycosyltransferase involved in cell wall biosynthesis